MLTFSNPLKSIVATFALSLGQVNIYGLKRQFSGDLFPINFLFLTIFVVFFWALLKEVKNLQLRQLRVKGFEIIAIGLLALLGNLLLGFTVKYSQVGLVYPLYLHSLISYLFVCLGLSLFLVRINFRLATLIILLISIFSYLTLFSLKFSCRFGKSIKSFSHEIVPPLLSSIAHSHPLNMQVEESKSGSLS